VIHNWTRFWTKPDGAISLADQGFLVARSTSSLFAVDSPDLWTFEEIATRRCLVLLGEPGMGKTRTLEAEAAELTEIWSQTGDYVLRVDLGATRDESVLTREIFGSNEFEEWAAGDRELHLFLDSLDEATLRLGVVGDIILKGLDGVDASRLRVRLACRTADRLPAFEAKLRALWPGDDSGVYELAPLRREDVRIAAEDLGIDAREFLRELVERDLVPLAIKPVTLAMLLDLAAEQEGFPDSHLELYGRGLRHLAAEPAERRRRDPNTKGQLNAGQRLAVAGRIAAATILTGRTAVSTADTPANSPDVVTLAQLAGGVERDADVAVPTSFQVSDDGLREVLGTGLFSARGIELGWAHHTYGEYLAGRYLTDTGMSLPQKLSLLTVEARERRIVPQLRDVAGWAAAMDPLFHDDLARRDPLVLLRGDVGPASDEKKAHLAEALMQKRIVEELNPYDPRTRRNLAALRHENLAQAVRSRAVDRGAPVLVREFACRLAGLCELHVLQEDLLTLALSPEEPLSVRVQAVRALQLIADDECRRRLVPLARDPLPEDFDDDLKGSALRLVCPAVVRAAEALAFVTPQKNRDLHGAYAGFLSRDLPTALHDDELPEALAWVRRVAHTRDPMDEVESLAEQILVRGAEAMERDEVLAAVAETVADYLAEHRDLQSFRTRDKSEAFRAEDNRYRLVTALLPMMCAGQVDPMSVMHSTPRLITGRDLPWLLDQLPGAVGTDDEPIWAELIDWAASWVDADHDLVMDARERSPILYEQTRIRFGPIELNSELAASLRHRHRRDQELLDQERELAVDASDLDAALDARLDRIEAGELDAYWDLNVGMWMKGLNNISVGGSDLTVSPGWLRADAVRRARISAAALPYLLGFELKEAWANPGRLHLPSMAGYRALRYLAEHDPATFNALGNEVLCRWVPAVLTFTQNSGDDDEQTFGQWILGVVAERCPAALIECSRRLLLAEAEHGEGTLFALYPLRSVLPGQLGANLLELWKTTELRATPQAELLEALLAANVEGAVEAGLGTLEPALIATEPERARKLAATLLGHGTGSVWSTIWPLLRNNADWGAEVFEALAANWDRTGDFRGDLNEEELADLFVWLSKRFPRDEDPSRLGTHWVGPREQVAEYRDQILRSLADTGSEDAIRALDRIERSIGHEFPFLRIRAEEAWQVRRWIPPRPEDVVALGADGQRRVVLSAADLQHVLIEALDRLQHMLREEGQAHQVWDTASRQPKQETEVAAWIADRLRDDLRGRGIVINREVEVRVNPRGGVGERTDINVDAVAHERVEGAEQVAVVLEVKGCWHAALLTAMRSQLADEYLSAARRYGIYLVAWFGLDQWQDQSDRRRQACARLDPDELLPELTRQADALRREGLEIAPVLLDASLG
jgi:hypothetical protein